MRITGGLVFWITAFSATLFNFTVVLILHNWAAVIGFFIALCWFPYEKLKWGRK